MRSTLSIPKEKLIVDEERLLSFEDTILLKDFCPKKIKSLAPELSEVIDSLIAMAPENQFVTVDVMKHNFKTKGKTCVDTSFHVDGIGNDYIIWSLGDFRTEFLTEAVEIKGLGERKPSELSSEIKEKTAGLRFNEAGNSVPMSYSSTCIHRGRNAEAGSKRIMIRICSSSYLRPKNVDLKKVSKLF